MCGRLPNPVGWELLVPCPDPSRSSFHFQRERAGLGEAALRPSPEREPVLLNLYFPPWNNQGEKCQALM